MNNLVQSLSQKKYFLPGTIIITLLSLIPRLYYLDKPVWDWRPYQTLLTTYWFTQEGIDLINYKTPLFGFPWQVPFEFPLYQAAGAWLSDFSLFSDLIFASRIVSLTVFYLSSVALLVLILEYTNDRFVTFSVFFVYLWHPYNIIYSTEILIDFASVTFALFYIYLFIKWIKSPARWWLALIGVFSGIIGVLIKITTMGIVIIPIIIAIINLLTEQGIFQCRTLSGFLKWLYRRLFFMIGIGIFLFVPILLGLLWTKHADGIKAASTSTVWLTSYNLKDWNYGTWEQKTSIINWIQWMGYLNRTILYDAVLIFPIIGGWAFRKSSKELSGLFTVAVFGITFTLFTFFNLFLHEYYWISLSPYACILIGLGIYASILFACKGNLWQRLLISLVVIFVGSSSIRRGFWYETRYIENIENVTSRYSVLAETIKSEIPKNGHIIAIQTGWYPQFVYLAERKTMIIQQNGLSTINCKLIEDNSYQAVVLVDEELTEALDKVLNCFSNVQIRSPQIYWINNP